MTEAPFYHESVLLHECIANLDIDPDGTYLDATFGGGGHSKAILSQLSRKGRLIAFDQDADAKMNLPSDDRVCFVPENFRYADRFVRLYEWGPLNGVLADLGVSSFQFDTPEKGFSIRYDAPLDMRMDRRSPSTAATVLATYSEAALRELFETYGEVTNAKVLASKIVQQRSVSSIKTIDEFKQVISGCVYGNPHKYLAQVFQALRIEVNEELEVLKDFLRNITPHLASGARMCIITFHSLEDRLVKQWMKQGYFEEEQTNPFAQHQTSSLKVVHKKPIVSSEEEVKRNPRARSAKLRVAVKR